MSEGIYQDIMNPPEGHANVGQWCKKIDCWERVKKLNFFIDLDESLLIEKEIEKYKKREAKKEKKILQGIEIQVFVVKTPLEKWINLNEYFQRENYSGLSSIEKGVLNSMAQYQIPLPTERQSKVLYKLFLKAEKEGLVC